MTSLNHEAVASAVTADNLAKMSRMRVSPASRK
jgi:hypothetical protein